MSLNQELIRQISKSKQEPSWMLKKRLEALAIYRKLSLPSFGPDLSSLDLDEINLYKSSRTKKTDHWRKVPTDLRKIFTKLGIPQAEQKFLAGVGTQVDSEVIYQNIKKKWQKKGIIFEDMDTAVKKYPQLVKKYFMTHCVVSGNNKFAALHGAVWSGGSFVYVPKGVVLREPVEGYFFLKTRQMGQFEHTLIIAEENSQLTYIEGCSAPQYSQYSFHSGAVEIFVGKNAQVTYLTIQNWSKNIYNLNTKRALVEQRGKIEWVSGSFGSKATMLYPTSILMGRGASSDHLSITVAGQDQELDTGGKVIHRAPETSSTVLAKSIVKDSGRAVYRGMAKIERNARKSKTAINCESLILGKRASTQTFPSLIIEQEDSQAYHEAKTGKIAEEQIFYLMSRGLSEKEATSLIVNGFLEPIVTKFPEEYGLELNRLVDWEIKGGRR